MTLLLNLSLFRPIFFNLLIISFLIIFTLWLGTRSKRAFIKVIAINFLVGLFILCLFEIGSYLFLKYHSEESQGYIPSYILFYENPKLQPRSDIQKRLYGDFVEGLGRWRVPNRSVVWDRCSDTTKVKYNSNNVGARDINRSKVGKNRTVVLGDSFIEALLINEPNRLSNLLEKETKKEFLNFGINSANPVAYHQIYEKLVKDKFEHDDVIIGLFVGNDFDIFSSFVDGAFINYPIYRVFWENNKIKSTLPSINDSMESFYVVSHPERVRAVRDSLYQSLNIERKIKVGLQLSSNLGGLIRFINSKRSIKNYLEISFYKTPNLESDERKSFIYGLDRLVEVVGNKKLTIVLIPEKKDLLHYKEGDQPEYTNFLKKRYANRGIHIIDLLPPFIESKLPADSLYIPCDGHWSERGNLEAAKAVLKYWHKTNSKEKPEFEFL